MEGVTALQNTGVHRLMLKEECADGKIPFFQTVVEGFLRCYPDLRTKITPVSVAGTLHFSHYETLDLLYTSTALDGGPTW